LRGYKRVRSLADNGAFAAIEPTMRFISQRMYSLMPDGMRDRLEREISMAGNVAGLLPQDLAALTLLSGLLGATAGGIYGYLNNGVLLFTVIVGLAGAFAPYLYLVSVGHERQRRIHMSMPQVIDLLSLSLGAGLDFPASIRQIVDRTGHPDEPLYEELRLVLQDLSLGRTRRQALEQFADQWLGTGFVTQLLERALAPGTLIFDPVDAPHATLAEAILHEIAASDALRNVCCSHFENVN